MLSKLAGLKAPTLPGKNMPRTESLSETKWRPKNLSHIFVLKAEKLFSYEVNTYTYLNNSRRQCQEFKGTSVTWHYCNLGMQDRKL